jgi:uncharacterized protein YwgA
MASTDKRLKNRELVLLVADAAGGTLDGRVKAQKLIYFCGLALGQPTGHTAYFYGPYSDDFESALNRAVMAGELSETVERIQDWYGGPDARKHIYTLTDRGKGAVAEIKADHQEEAKVVDETVAIIAEEIPEFRQRTLSAAAKINHIVSEQDRAVSDAELQTLARQLGWHLKKSDIDEAVGALVRLGFIVRN